jgi:predicted transcriptional regulator
VPALLKSLQQNLLWERPGFVVRRLHQIHSAMFVDACGAFGVTPLQYSLLSVLKKRPGLSQNSLGEQLGIDRSNAFDVVQRLNRAGLISLIGDPADKRKKRPCSRQRAAIFSSELNRPHSRPMLICSAVYPKRTGSF